MSIIDYLRDHRVWFETLLHRPASSATKLAQSVHVPGRAVAKGVLVRAGEGYVLAVLPATLRIDLVRLGEALRVSPEELRLATEDELLAVFGDCEAGVSPPFGRLYGLTTVVDTSLAGVSEIVFAGNSRHLGLRMRYRDYEALESPRRARFARPIQTDTRRAG
jgi:Ala-tRNA(Pro) deacylase